ncbi:hypothetical protein SDC9_147810 [bioreactor metagenome]|uniref:Uncharacterized protein n=1 Tax=bioreactor metagenome TaxID=1076179 RepID=A0A645EIQ5_9ZZZZ
MGFEKECVLIQCPNVDVMDVFYRIHLFEFLRDFIDVHRFRCSLHQDVRRLFHYFIAFLEDVQSDQHRQ